MLKTYSFIIPHHNTPDLLLRLLDTIPQRKDIEVIVVDDNSDEDKKAKSEREDVKIIYIDKEHTRGAGKARNIGMEVASGKWLLFADADDLYNDGFVDILDEYKDDDIDILFFNVDSVDSETLKHNSINRSTYQQRLIQEYEDSGGSEQAVNNLLFFSYGPWRKMLNKSFIFEYGFKYEEIAITNDSFFSLQTSYFARNWKVDRRIVYILTYRENSLSHSNITKEKYSTILNVFRRRAKLFEYMGHPEWNLRSARGYRSQSCFRYIGRLLKHKPLVGVKALFYYLFNCYSIEKNSNYYVNIIEGIRNNSNKNY